MEAKIDTTAITIKYRRQNNRGRIYIMKLLYTKQSPFQTRKRRIEHYKNIPIPKPEKRPNTIPIFKKGPPL